MNADKKLQNDAACFGPRLIGVHLRLSAAKFLVFQWLSI
jgi:hypothetical protein